MGRPGARRCQELIDRSGQPVEAAMNENQQVPGCGHLWAIGYDDMQRAEQVRDEITRIGWDEHYLLLSDVAGVVRHPDGSLTVDREPFPAVANILGCSAVGFLAGLVVAAPLAGAAIGAVVGGAGSAAAAGVGISDDFIRDVEAMMKRGA